MLSKIGVIRSKIAFHLLRKPRYLSLDNNANLKKGILCISLDFELAWAWRYVYMQKVDMQKLCRQERENIPKILKKFDELNIPATWAIVGHLFLERCSKTNGIPHSDMPRPDYFRNDYWEFKKGDWYDQDPCSDFKSAPDWYAPDLIEKILNAKVHHEIACHSFSHIGFNEKYCPNKLAEAEINKCNEVMGKFGIKPVSMVFPGDEAGHFEILKRYDYKCVRYFPLQKVEISKPIRLKEGLWAILSSSNIIPDDNWDSNYILWRLKKYIQKSIEKKALCHFWFHPSISQERVKEVLFPVLEYCAERREEGNLDIFTMQEIGELMDTQCMIQDTRIKKEIINVKL